MGGALAAMASAALWAFASTRYALASRLLGSARVNLTRATTVLPVFMLATLLSTRGHPFADVTTARAGWLLLSVLCAYAFADNIFFAAARRVGITTALAIASSYPLWAAVAGVLWRGERFGPLRGGGTLLCVGGIVALIVLAPQAADEHEHARSTEREAREGIVLALLTSILWAGNSVSTKLGGTGLPAWQANLVRFSCAWPILAATSALMPRPTADNAAAVSAYRALVPVSLAEACVGSSLFVYGLSHTDLAVGATLSSLAPLMSVPFALLYREERWSLPRFCAVAVTVAGVIVLVVGA
jgi:drug/metabolite transporter (DMT)-like permease